jgi:hypothetical protein
MSEINSLGGIAKALADDELFYPVGKMLEGVALSLAGEHLASPVGPAIERHAEATSEIATAINNLAEQVGKLAWVIENRE